MVARPMAAGACGGPPAGRALRSVTRSASHYGGRGVAPMCIHIGGLRPRLVDVWCGERRVHKTQESPSG